MHHHDPKTCPRCHQDFKCQAETVWQCQCQGVTLTAEHHAYIAQRFSDCLCVACLAELKVEYDTAQRQNRIESLLKNR